MSRVLALVSGLVFALGLDISGMTRPNKVLAFLDVSGAWDPSLAFVMLGALGVFFIADRLTRHLRRPLYAESFPPRPTAKIDRRLLVGAALFGIGWGLSGFCPGPALASFGAGTRAALWFVPAMIVGMALEHAVVGGADRD